MAKKSVDAPAPEVSYEEEMSVPFKIDDLADLKLGQEVVVTLRGCICRLEGSPYFSNIGIKLDSKTLRKTGSQQEGLDKLMGDGEDDY